MSPWASVHSYRRSSSDPPFRGGSSVRSRRRPAHGQDVWIDGLGPKLLLVWAGLALGVAFLATPAKFLAPSLSLPVALDVGRHTFAVYDRLELTLLAAWLTLGLWSADRPRWYLAALVPGAVVAAEALWLLPALDRRVAVVLAGGSLVDDPVLHAAYIGCEVVKAAALLMAGLWRRD